MTIFEINIIIVCEESQIIANLFRDAGFNAYSNDLKPCSGGHPEYHLQMDCFEALKLKEWHLMIAHPPCTFLAGSGAHWLSHPDDKNLPFNQRRPHPLYPNRREDLKKSIEFVKELFNQNIGLIAIENPIGLLSTYWRKPDQIIHPYYFGDSVSKGTCLWLKGLPKLYHNKEINLFDDRITHVDKGEYIEYGTKGKRQHKWFYSTSNHSEKGDIQAARSKTFPGIAQAIVNQWGEFIKEKMLNRPHYLNQDER